mmetsp:Transcript_20897/g.24553  ORF Transcript_20897/g.24553 Transcript_20897/m.24553 type:complete len:144 (-) Transcript_20897:2379-2810(-)|eukprot:CAMPEP_0170466116 /NCGR_PEP_ID=MMETSP0123-20130129/10202_1 /TAXON_ID=182087 /ORGANISM="Favella ehrenbergii, Strain Fehren 1" /LENGTH=143 /DNA_ID=CAMNT_0010732175 /DNA_START=43 /DNA_END=474 /DNA_ORIENTATION=-
MRQSKQGGAAAAREEQKAPLPAGKAMVRSVPSGDQICLVPVSKKAEQGDPLCYLAHINVPRVGNPNRNEEPLAHEAREFVRERIIGRKVDYKTEYMAGTKKAVSVSIEGEDLASQLVSKSLAKVSERRTNTVEGGLHDTLLKI